MHATGTFALEIAGTGRALEEAGVEFDGWRLPQTDYGQLAIEWTMRFKCTLFGIKLNFKS